MTLRLRFSFEQFVITCGIERERVQHFVANAWISPAEPENQVFDEEDLARARLIDALQNDMGLNDEAVPVVLHLIDQLNRMHNEIKKRI